MFFRSVTIHSKKGSIVALLAPKFKKNEIVGLIRRTALGLYLGLS
jgi:hypothetical protein